MLTRVAEKQTSITCKYEFPLVVVVTTYYSSGYPCDGAKFLLSAHEQLRSSRGSLECHWLVCTQTDIARFSWRNGSRYPHYVFISPWTRSTFSGNSSCWSFPFLSGYVSAFRCLYPQSRYLYFRTGLSNSLQANALPLVKNQMLPIYIYRPWLSLRTFCLLEYFSAHRIGMI